MVLNFVLGIITSFFGSIPPSMLNMTAAKIRMDKGKKNAHKFAFGVSLIVLFQAYLAILFTKYLKTNPYFLDSLQKIAAIIFLFLSVYFFNKARKEKSQLNVNKNQTRGNSFRIGLILSALNMFSIPFYCGVSTALDTAGWVALTQQNILIFVIGAAIGTFLILNVYVLSATFIQKKAAIISKNINYILSFLTFVLGLYTLIIFL